MHFRHRLFAVASLSAALAVHVAAQVSVAARPTRDSTACFSCREWNEPHKPVRIFGNTYYVGTNALSAILITSNDGHILIDGDIEESVPQIVEHIRALGFRIEDVKLILNSHVHYDHAGGLAELQQLSKARVAASAASAAVLRTGKPGRDDPQFELQLPYPPVTRVDVVKDGETLHVGPLAITMHSTPGHTPGGTSWSWKSCEGDRCLDIVYADSQTPISADGFSYTTSREYPNALRDFDRGLSTLEKLSCDILVTPHPAASSLWERVARRDAGDANALVDRTACARYAATGREAVAKRVEAEKIRKPETR